MNGLSGRTVVGVTDQADAQLVDGLADGRIGQGAHLLLALDEIDGREVRRAVAGVAGQLGPSRDNLFPQQLLQERNTDILELRHHPLPLSEESTDKVYPAIASQGNVQRGRELPE